MSIGSGADLQVRGPHFHIVTIRRFREAKRLKAADLELRSTSGNLMKVFYRRRLPHWQPPGATVFLTYRLFGSLPKAVLERLALQRDQLLKASPVEGEPPRDRALREGKRLFQLLDQSLDEQAAGGDSATPRWLGRNDVAQWVRRGLRFGEGTRYREHRYVILPNHVHWLIEPLPKDTPHAETNKTNSEEADKAADEASAPITYWSLAEITKSLKSYTARKANQLLRHTGTFWQDESFDHWARDGEEFQRIIAYIDANPVKAGLCRNPGDWFWSSAHEMSQSGADLRSGADLQVRDK